jgi:hypothetical protein
MLLHACGFALANASHDTRAERSPRVNVPRMKSASGFFNKRKCRYRRWPDRARRWWFDLDWLLDRATDAVLRDEVRVLRCFALWCRECADSAKNQFAPAERLRTMPANGIKKENEKKKTAISKAKITMSDAFDGTPDTIAKVHELIGFLSSISETGYIDLTRPPAAE